MAAYTITAGTNIPFHNNVDYCVGTGRMGLALQKHYYDQLALVQEEIGFQYIRGHGLFSDDMAIYHEYTDANGDRQAEYNFTYLDLVMDSYQKLGIKPFLELGFMPGDLASGDQTVFYWKGNVTPAREDKKWTDLVIATLGHLMERYGEETALSFPIEVWNEPNLPGFWKDADMEAYFHLFEVTFRAIKEFNPGFQIGGPAICGVDDVRWMKEFLVFCQKAGLDPDFITRHHYTSEPPEVEGHYSYIKLSDLDGGLSTLDTTREIVDSFPEFKGKQIYITEFNTSYVPDAPVHDTNQNAAYIAELLSKMGGVNEAYSYWTFGDIFEERGVPFTPFHGGFGLVTNGLIPKPTFWSFKFYKNLEVFQKNGAVCVMKNNDGVILEKDGTYQGVLWNNTRMTGDQDKTLSITLPLEGAEGEYCLVTETVDEETCNPLKAWHDLGEPSSLTEAQRKFLKDNARPFAQTARKAAKDCKTLTFTLNPDAVVYFELRPLHPVSDRGYDYKRVMTK